MHTCMYVCIYVCTYVMKSKFNLILLLNRLNINDRNCKIFIKNKMKFESNIYKNHSYKYIN